MRKLSKHCHLEKTIICGLGLLLVGCVAGSKPISGNPPQPHKIGCDTHHQLDSIPPFAELTTPASRINSTQGFSSIILPSLQEQPHLLLFVKEGNNWKLTEKNQVVIHRNQDSLDLSPNLKITGERFILAIVYPVGDLENLTIKPIVNSDVQGSGNIKCFPTKVDLLIEVFKVLAVAIASAFLLRAILIATAVFLPVLTAIASSVVLLSKYHSSSLTHQLVGHQAVSLLPLGLILGFGVRQLPGQGFAINL